MKKLPIVIALLLLVCVLPNAAALTVIEGDGNAYPIAEESAAKRIRDRYLMEKKERKKFSPEELENKLCVHLTDVPVSANEKRTRIVDPSYTLPFDITDNEGRIIGNYRKGYTFNPLDRTHMTSLIVIDGTKENQIRWAESKRKELKPSKILLSKGSFYGVMRKYRLRVFHLSDDIMNRMEIERVPCTVIQKGNRLEVTEYRSDRIPKL